MKKIIDENGRLFGKISIVDIIVLIVAVLLVFAAYVKLSDKDSPIATVNTVPVTYTITVNLVRETPASLLREGDKLYTDSGTFIGTIKSTKIEPSYMNLFLADGSCVLAPVEDRFTVFITVEVQCSESNGRYYADRTYELNLNTEQKLITKYNAVTGIITDITVNKEG